jgi:hypothetical protein
LAAKVNRKDLECGWSFLFQARVPNRTSISVRKKSNIEIYPELPSKPEAPAKRGTSEAMATEIVMEAINHAHLNIFEDING